MKISSMKRPIFLNTVKVIFWFCVGAALGLFLFVSFAFIIFQKINSNVVYPGITVDELNLSGKNEQAIKDFFMAKNDRINPTQFVFTSDFGIATISASQIDYGYDKDLLAKQAIAIGRGDSLFSNIILVMQAYTSSIRLRSSYRYSEDKLLNLLSSIINKAHVDPVDALFTFQNGKATAFQPSGFGQAIDLDDIKNQLNSQFLTVMSSEKPQTIIISVPIKILKPNITTDKVNNLGIKELLATGTSTFHHSIPNRIFNITLAASRLNGILVHPGETFSFDKALGDVSSFTGYQQAYIIQNGKTVLGDGGGVCQVSTTLFRAILNAGFPVIERHAHAYRVGYYEQDSPPGFDATIYSPSIDLKFKNDTDNYILIQAYINPEIQQLTFFLYGSRDGREVEISKPIITNDTPAPSDMYQDDPTLPKGVVKQIDFAARGANVSFTREVKKNGKIILSDKYVSDFQPWQAIYLRGTKE